MSPKPAPEAWEDRSDYPEVSDYGLIGNGRAAALVSSLGSLDWLCLPRFDSPSVFGALLDRRRGGRFVIRPVRARAGRRGYVGNTNVLRTEMQADGGVLAVTDLMPVASEEHKRGALWPDHEVLRVVECLQGEVEVELLCDPRPGYGEVAPRVRRAGFPGWQFDAGNQTLVLLSELEARPFEYQPGVYGRTRMRAGERRVVSLAYSADRPSVLPVLGDAAIGRLRTSLDWWEAWAGRCKYQGPYRDAVVRSALALKLMVYAPSGAIIAAPTTSLPEVVGADRNWDYRYCWLRDASFTMRALLDLGYLEEASAFLSWLLHATRLTWPRLNVLYDVFGGARQRERLLPLEGYRGSRPVRIGNAAHRQLQLDTYGAVVDAAFRFTRAGGTLDRSGARMLAGLGMSAAELWRQPDQGIWEPRTGPRQHTLSKVMCWVALDRLLTMAFEGHVEVPTAELRRKSLSIRAEIDTRGYSRRLGSYVSELDSERLDAGLLLLPIYGYADPRSARMSATVQRVLGELSDGPVVRRFRTTEDGTPAREGAFGLCSFWAARCEAIQGDLEGARDRFERLLGFSSDLGLFAEEFDPRTGAAVGNFPQAYTHVGVINAACTLEEAAARPRPRAHRAEPAPAPVSGREAAPRIRFDPGTATSPTAERPLTAMEDQP